MSIIGQGDQISETNKDDEPEISSTPSENIGLKETVGNLNATSAAIDPEDTETSAVKFVAPNIPSSSFDKNLVADAVIASTTAKIQKNLDIMHEGSQLRVDAGCELGNTEISLPKAEASEIPPEAVSSDVTKEAGIGSPNTGILKKNAEKIQAKPDKDSSYEEDFELKWDADDDATGPKHTDHVLEMLDKAPGEDALKKPGSFKITSEEETIINMKDTKTDENEEKDVIKAMTANESNASSQKMKYTAEIDMVTQDDEMDKTTECENPVTVDKTVNHPEENKTPKNTVELEIPDIESKQKIDISIKPFAKDDEVMDVDDTGDIIEKELIKVAMSKYDSFGESKKIIAEIDSFTQDDEINKTTISPVETDKPLTLVESDKKLENVEMPIIDQVVSEKPETVSKESPLIPLTKEDDEMDLYDSGDITQEKEITEDNDTFDVAVTASDSYKKSQKIVPDLDSLTRDKTDKTAELPTVTELDKQLEDVEIPNDELIESEKPNTENLITKTVSIEIPLKPLTKDDNKMDAVESGENTKDKEIIIVATPASVSFDECQKTIAENDRSTQDDKIEKTAKRPSEIALRHNPLPVNELDKKLDDVEILMNDVQSEPETKAIKVPSKVLTKDDQGMMKTKDVDDSNVICKIYTATDNFTAEVTEAQDTLDSIQKEEVRSTKDKEVLDNIEDKQDTNMSHDNKAEVLKPAENKTSVNDIPSTDRTTLKEDPLMPVKDGQNKLNTTEDLSEKSQPVNDKNKENDALDTIQALDDKLTTVQMSKSNNGQKINDTASSMQDNKKSSEEQNIALKFSESQAVDDKVSDMQDIDEKTLEAENILLNTETAGKLEENASILDDSLIDTTISPNKHHRINKPNVMLDIPTQDFSDIEAELSDSENNDDFEKTLENKENIEKSTKIVQKPSESNKSVIFIPEISGITTPTIEIDATTSKLNITTVSPLKLNQASTTDVKIDDKSSTKTQDILMKNDNVNVAEKSSQEVEKSDVDKPSSSMQVDDQQPSCSKDIGDVKLDKLTSDDADDVQESDSLGLLAESSRVMDDDIDDDDEEPEELEPDDNDDDEDFDPYEESTSQMLEDADTDESNPPTEVKTEETEIIDADEQNDGQMEIKPERITNILEKVLGNFADLKPPVVSSGSVLNYVEVEGSSDSDDVEEISKPEAKDLISVTVPAEVDVMLTSGAEGGTSAMRSSKDEVVISVPKPQYVKVAKINTSAVTIKSASKDLESLQIPETTTVSEKKSKDEVFNIDSDDEEEKKIEELLQAEEKEHSPEPPTPPKSRKCINPHCTSTSGVYSKASRATISYYSLTRRSGTACQDCKEKASERSQALVNGIKDLRPLLALDMEAPSHQLVEISDSDEDEEPVDESEKIGEKGAKFILDNLVDVFNEVWVKYEMDRRLKQTESHLMDELERIEAGAMELDAILNECQIKTDAVRTDFYKAYEPKRKHVGGIVIHDTPFSSYSHTEKDIELTETPSNRYPKRRSASNLFDPPAKKQAVFVDSQDKDKQGPIDQSKMEDDKDISVVKLSAESAPASLPPHGELLRPALHAGMSVYAMRNAFGTWNKAKILEIVQEASAAQAFTQCRVKFEHKVKNSCKVLAARCLAYSEPCEVRYTIGTRVIALFKDPQSARLDAYYAGVVAEVPNPVNNYRYLVFFDDGYAQYIQHADTRLVCQASALVWEEVHPFIHDFVRNYLKCYPERPMVRLRQGETLNTEWNGKWWSSRVLKVDASIALIYFDQDDRTEWIYRGSTRLEPLYLELQAAKAGGRSRLRLPRTKQIRSNMPCVEYTRSDEQANAKAAAEAQAHQRQAEELRRQRAVARKSTTDRQSHQHQTVIQDTPFEGIISRVVYYTPKHAVKPARMDSHECGPACGKRPDLLTLKDLRTYNPLAKPLLSGWERQTVRYKGHREVVYRAPCGRRLRNMPELHRYLSMLQSDLSVDLFDFTAGTHCLAEFMLSKCIVGKKDLSHGKENVPVPCVNYYDDSLPEFCSYNTERTPTAGVPLNLDPDFLCGCDCTDDCQDKSKCACWKMTLEGARTIGLEGDNIGYVYRRLPEPLPSGIYECNSRCKCKQTCLNRVAQHPLQLKLQVFKTVNRGWGIRALNDVPKGAFLCIYAGNLLTDATANLDGINEGDEYLAELDYIEVVEGMKEGYEDDVPEKDKAMGKKGASRASESEPELSSESEEEKERSGKDDDFQPNAYIPQPQGDGYFQKSLRRREKAKRKDEEKVKQKEQEAAKKGDDCITISDDEEVRQPSRFTADDIAGGDRKHSSRVSVRTLFGKDEACYIMDAKVQGNIGRYLNHSCHPNVFVQNVFVDTHDPRFPWVAFFALAHVRAGHELTWNYNYDSTAYTSSISTRWTDGMIDAHSRLFSSKVGILLPTGSPAKVFRKVTHCIFDLDGTLIDSEFVYQQMVHTICEKYGKNYSKEMEHKNYGGTDREICVAVVKELKLPISADEMENQLTNISSKMLPNSPLMPGAARLLRHLHDYKIPMALATNSTNQAVRLHVASKPAFFGMFHHKVSVTDPGVLRGKPHPDLYLLAASKFDDKPKPAKCLVFEDSEKGVLAAKEAGMQVVMIPDIRIDREKTRNATLIIRSLLDFKPELFGLPPFDGTKGENKTKPDGNKVTYTTKQSEEKSSKDGVNNNMILREGERKSVFESVVERKSIRLSVIDKLVGRTIMQDRIGLHKRPHGISFIDNLLKRKGTEDVGNKDKRPHIISDERKSKSIPERFGNRKVSIFDGPHEKKSIIYGPKRSFENSILKVVERKSQRTSVENKTPKSVEDQRKGAEERGHQKSKKEKKSKTQ